MFAFVPLIYALRNIWVVLYHLDQILSLSHSQQNSSKVAHLHQEKGKFLWMATLFIFQGLISVLLGHSFVDLSLSLSDDPARLNDLFQKHAISSLPSVFLH